MPTLARLIAVMVGLFLVVVAAVFLFLRSPVSSDGLHRMAIAVGVDAAPPERHVVPEDFQGWVVVHFAVEGAPPLREEDGALIIEYPASGRLDTSTPAPEGEGLLQRGYYRKTPDGLTPLSRATDIWGEFSHRQFRDDHSEIARRLSRGEQVEDAGRSTGFFVGTLREYRANERPVEHRRPVAADE